MKIIALSSPRITIELDENGGGAIDSDLHIAETDPEWKEPEEAANYNAAIDGLESVVLAHACAGVDVQNPQYLQGLEIALQAIENHLAP